MTKTLAVFLKASYLIRCEVIDNNTINEIAMALECFCQLRSIFKDVNVRRNFCLPRQHVLDHYISFIHSFGAPNGLCSSITESMHIAAVKEPWHRSNQFEASKQMLGTTQRLSKLAAACSDFLRCGMLTDLAHNASIAHQDVIENTVSSEIDCDMDEDAGEVSGPTVENYVTMAKKLSKYALFLSLASVVMLKCTVQTYPRTLDAVGQKIGCLRLLELCRRFLYDTNNPHTPNQLEIPLHELPLITDTNVRVFHSATAYFRAPSDPSGVEGMRHEVIRATPSW